MIVRHQRIFRFGAAFVLASMLGCAGSGGPLKIRRIQTFDKALARQRALHAPEFDLKGPSEDPARHLATGDVHRAQGRNSEAHRAYVRAHFADPESLVPLERIAYLALREDTEHARILFEELVTDAPDAPGLRVGLGYALAASGELEAAREQLEHAVELNPTSQAALLTLGIVSDRLGDSEAAVRAYERALAAGLNNAQVLNSLGVSYLLANRAEDAVSVFKNARALEPRNPVFSNNLGLALGLLGRDAAAMTAFERTGSEGDALNNLGLARYLRGDLSGARTLFERALLTNETDELRVLRNLERVEQASSQPGDA
ncbi:MAG: tetratricopeptide repeat protein [bacterium]|nr:tetratricopeptide repeat protein [bacterium]